MNFLFFCVAMCTASVLAVPSAERVKVQTNTDKDFKIFEITILEKNILVKETIEVNKKENYVLIDMPKHNDLDATLILHDFNQMRTLRVFPDKGHCMMTSDDPQMTPKPSVWLQVKEEDIKSEIWDANGIKNTNFTYAVMGEIQDRRILSDRMQEICPQSFQLYNTEVEQYWDEHDGVIFVEPHKNEVSAVSKRQKRQIIIETCPTTSMRRACIKKDVFCQWIIICPEVQTDVNGRVSPHCKDHKKGTVTWCRPCCLDREAGDEEESPFCGSKIITEKWICRGKC